MLGRNPDNASAPDANTSTVVAQPEMTVHGFDDEGGVVEKLMDASEPIFPTPPSPFAMDEFLTSPNLSTPYDTMADDFSSPLDDSPFSDFLNTPIMQTLDGFLDAGDPNVSLFPEYQGIFDQLAPPKPKDNPASLLDNLLQISPETPALDTIDSADPSPNMPVSHSFSAPTASLAPPAPVTRRKVTGATGTRKNITPESLVPIDAPTQPRKYVMPSATSRKEVPVGFAKKRARSAAFGDDDEELEELPPDATEKEQIEWKRRQNTLAARKSRKRKLEYTQNLEAENNALKLENEGLRARVGTLEAIFGKAPPQ